jgi:hypothetical protein
MLAILTKWHPPSPRKPMRIVAWCDGGKLAVTDIPDGPSYHLLAAVRLVKKLGRRGELIQAKLPPGGASFVALLKEVEIEVGF